MTAHVCSAGVLREGRVKYIPPNLIHRTLMIITREEMPVPIHRHLNTATHVPKNVCTVFGVSPASIHVETAKWRSPCQLNRFARLASNSGANLRFTRLSCPTCPPRRLGKIKSSGFEYRDCSFHARSAATSVAAERHRGTPAVFCTPSSPYSTTLLAILNSPSSKSISPTRAAHCSPANAPVEAAKVIINRVSGSAASSKARRWFWMAGDLPRTVPPRSDHPHSTCRIRRAPVLRNCNSSTLCSVAKIFRVVGTDTSRAAIPKLRHCPRSELCKPQRTDRSAAI